MIRTVALAAAIALTCCGPVLAAEPPPAAPQTNAMLQALSGMLREAQAREAQHYVAELVATQRADAAEARVAALEAELAKAKAGPSGPAVPQ